jgi:hypothetical protein
MRQFSIVTGVLIAISLMDMGDASTQLDPRAMLRDIVRPGGVIDTLSKSGTPDAAHKLSDKPSIDCAKVAIRSNSGAVARILCSGSDGASADWDLNATLWAVAGTKDDPEQKAFDQDQQRWREWLNKQCSLTRDQCHRPSHTI